MGIAYISLSYIRYAIRTDMVICKSRTGPGPPLMGTNMVDELAE